MVAFAALFIAPRSDSTRLVEFSRIGRNEQGVMSALKTEGAVMDVLYKGRYYARVYLFDNTTSRPAVADLHVALHCFSMFNTLSVTVNICAATTSLVSILTCLG